MATSTTNLSLRKPEGSDFVSVALDIAGNMQTIDDKFASSTPTAIAASLAAGSALTVARSDHAHNVGSGTVGSPGLPIGESNSGFYRIGSANIGATIAGALSWAFSATGIAIETALALKHVASVAALSGYVKIFAKSDEKLYKETGAGDEVEILDADIFTAQGDLVYGTGAEAYTQLAKGTARQALLMNSGATAPEWGSSLQSLLTATGDLPYASSANTPARRAIGTNGDILTATAGAPAWGRATALRNALIQGDPITQLEGNGPFTSATTPINDDASYVFDVWYLLSDGNDIADCSVVTSGLPTGARGKYRLDVETANKKVGIFQIVEQADIQDIVEAGCCSLSWDQQVTGSSIGGVRAAIFAWTSTADSPTRDLVSAWEAAGTVVTPVANWAVATGGDSGAIVPTTSWVSNSIANATIGSSVTNIAVGIWIDDTTTTVGDFLELTNICLVPGPAPVKVARAPRAVEAARTLRLYEVIGGQATTETTGNVAMCYSTTAAVLPLMFQVPKRVAPTSSISAASDWYLADAGNNVVACTGITFFSHTRRSAWANVTVASGMVAGNASYMLANSTLSARIRFTARF